MFKKRLMTICLLLGTSPVFGTLGNGNVMVGNQALTESSGINRDINKSQEITKNKVNEGTNINLEFDARYITDTKAKLAEDAENLKAVGTMVVVGGKLVGAAALDLTHKDSPYGVPMMATDKNGNPLVDENGNFVFVNSEVENVLVSGAGADVGKFTQRDNMIDEMAENDATSKVDYNGYVLKNSQVQNELQVLNNNLIDLGYPDDTFTILVTGGDRYRDTNNQNIIRSSTTGIAEKDFQKAKNSQHLDEWGNSAVDIDYIGVPKKDFQNALEKTKFSGYSSDAYSRKHTHISLERPKKKAKQ